MQTARYATCERLQPSRGRRTNVHVEVSRPSMRMPQAPEGSWGQAGNVGRVGRLGRVCSGGLGRVGEA
eukprot:8776683-Alexandrium_andersonii.AAC.1